MWSVSMCDVWFFFFFQAEDGIRDAQESRGLGDVYKRQVSTQSTGAHWFKAMGSNGSSCTKRPVAEPPPTEDDRLQAAMLQLTHRGFRYIGLDSRVVLHAESGSNELNQFMKALMASAVMVDRLQLGIVSSADQAEAVRSALAMGRIPGESGIRIQIASSRRNDEPAAARAEESAATQADSESEGIELDGTEDELDGTEDAVCPGRSVFVLPDWSEVKELRSAGSSALHWEVGCEDRLLHQLEKLAQTPRLVFLDVDGVLNLSLIHI
eukprot:TRINITY_DN15344_c0_g1_i2.p1 TRINITY_DN15344_c0_g1~~TRINITY_DN15344_c0_g1_i2.p1  ORF type:complete len:267 (-),score=77.68 TRINITY_DN15344_c0_g1_i2:131-931(-)